MLHCQLRANPWSLVLLLLMYFSWISKHNMKRNWYWWRKHVSCPERVSQFLCSKEIWIKKHSVWKHAYSTWTELKMGWRKQTELENIAKKNYNFWTKNSNFLNFLWDFLTIHHYWDITSALYPWNSCRTRSLSFLKVDLLVVSSGYLGDYWDVCALGLEQLHHSDPLLGWSSVSCWPCHRFWVWHGTQIPGCVSAHSPEALGLCLWSLWSSVGNLFFLRDEDGNNFIDPS